MCIRDRRINKKKSDEQFEASRMVEFGESPMDYEIGDVNVAANFIGAKYAADSSFASVVHIPVKLAMCKDSEPKKNPLNILKEAIRKKNKLYWKLVALEHRRWNAYTVTRGFRAVSYTHLDVYKRQEQKRWLKQMRSLFFIAFPAITMVAS